MLAIVSEDTKLTCGHRAPAVQYPNVVEKILAGKPFSGYAFQTSDGYICPACTVGQRLATPKQLRSSRGSAGRGKMITVTYALKEVKNQKSDTLASCHDVPLEEIIASAKRWGFYGSDGQLDDSGITLENGRIESKILVIECDRGIAMNIAINLDVYLY